MNQTTFRPKRPTSLSLENICCPDFGPTDFRKNEKNELILRHSKSVSADLRLKNFTPRTISFHSDQDYDPFLSSTKIFDAKNNEHLSTYNQNQSSTLSRTNSRESDFFPDIFTKTPTKVDVCVYTANGKIGPDIPRRPRPLQRIKVKSPTTIDYSFSKGKRKEVSSIDFTFSKNNLPKKPTNEDFSFNRSISRKPTSNDYTYGNHSVKTTTRKDFSYCKNSDPKPSTRYNYTYAPSRQKPTTNYNYKYNWEPSKPPTRCHWKVSLF